VIEELADNETLLRASVRAWRYWSPERQLSTAVWTEYRGTLAQVIESPLSWRVITAAFDAANRMNWRCRDRWQAARWAAQSGPGFGLADFAAMDAPVVARIHPEDETRAAWRAMRAGIRELEGIIDVTGPASRILREGEEIEQEYWPYGDGADFDEEAAVLAEDGEDEGFE
jgi:hypothetical protein